MPSPCVAAPACLGPNHARALTYAVWPLGCGVLTAECCSRSAAESLSPPGSRRRSRSVRPLPLLLPAAALLFTTDGVSLPPLVLVLLAGVASKAGCAGALLPAVVAVELLPLLRVNCSSQSCGHSVAIALQQGHMQAT